MNNSTTSVKEYYSSFPAWLKIVIIIAVVVGIYFLVKYIFKQIDDRRKEKIMEDSTAVGKYQDAAGNVVPVQVNLGTTAGAIHSKLYDNDWFGITEDEEGAMQDVLNTPPDLIKQLSATYYQLYNKNLKGDLQKYLSSEQWGQIANLFNY